ncbi:MAG: peptidoglycan editing factor PgeF [Alphaproteobacteria bacterium]
MTGRPGQLIDRDLQASPGVTHGFFTRHGGVSGGLYASLNCGIGSDDDRTAILANRARVATALGVAPTRLISPAQVHGSNVATVTDAWLPGEGPIADALVTRERGLAIGVGTADCAPILFADREVGVIGAAHAGWGGAIKGIIEATIAAMEAIGARNDRIVAAIGPAIGQESYEVGPEFHDRFIVDDPHNERFFIGSDRPNHKRFDLTGYGRSRLEKLELATIARLAGDTYADESRFFSFRRATHRGENDYGRMMSAIALT